MIWKIFYADGSTFDSDQGGPEDAPACGVVVIVQQHPDTGHYLQFSADYYRWEYGRWMGCDIVGQIIYLTKPGWKRVLFGETVENDRFQEMLKRADADSDFAPRSAYLPGEYRA